MYRNSAPQSPFGAGVSADKNMQLQKEMEEFEREFAALSEDEQKAFMQTMDDAVKKIEELAQTDEGKQLLDKLEKGTISDEELDGLINQLVEEEAPKPTAPETKKEEKKPEAPKQVLTSKHEKAIDAINSLIAHTNSFILKTATVPDMPSKVRRWARAGEIITKPGQTWSSFKTELEKFVELLNKLLERDPKTNEYYHIDELLKKESLLNNILKVQKNVAQNEPTVEEAPLLEVKKMKRSVKKAYQKLINEYHEALYILDIPEEIANLFKLFDPIAKKYREQEEQAVKEAERLGKQRSAAAARPQKGITTGSRASYANYDEPWYGDDYAQGSDYASYPSYAPSRRASGGPRDFSSPDRQARRTSPSSKKAGPKKGSAAKAKAEKKESAEKAEKEFKPSKATIKLGQDIDVALSKIQDKFKTAAEMIKENDIVASLDGKLTDASDIDVSFAVEAIPDLNKELNIKRGVLGDIQQLHRKLTHQPTRVAVQKRLRTAYDKEKKELDQLQKKLEDLEKNWSKYQISIPVDKQYAYFGETDIAIHQPEEETPTAQEAAALAAKRNKLEQAKQKVIAPYSLFEIKDLLEKIKKAINEFNNEKLPNGDSK
jgi:hypothetical protein